MKTRKNLRSKVNLKLFLVLSAIILVIVVFSSCAAKKKIATTKTEIAPPPPPPPPPPSPPPQTNSASKENPKVVGEAVTDESEEEPFVVVEEMPQFPGGDAELLKYIVENTKYPENAKKNNIQGKVITRFCVTSKGNVSKVTVLKAVDPEIDAEAVRVVSTLPSFKPGRQGGKDVPVWYMVPISFALSNSMSDTTTDSSAPPPPPPPSSSDKKSPAVMTGGAYQQVDEMPVFPGGDTALLKYLADSTHYPKEAKEKGIQGKIITRFMVKEDGTVSDVTILKGTDPSLDKEAIRVVKTLPMFSPGKLKGKVVPVWYMIPINFALK